MTLAFQKHHSHHLCGNQPRNDRVRHQARIFHNSALRIVSYACPLKKESTAANSAEHISQQQRADPFVLITNPWPVQGNCKSNAAAQHFLLVWLELERCESQACSSYKAHRPPAEPEPSRIGTPVTLVPLLWMLISTAS